jgi:endonuclease/exonuclease/phosphatase family metal-dependent hydrolase
MNRKTRNLTLALAAAAVFLAACADKAPEPAGLKTMSVNIRYDNPDDGPDAWPHRRAWLAQTINSQAPDVLGMQEVLLHQAEFLSAALPEHDWYGVGRDDGAQAGEFTPIFFRKDRFAEIDHGTFWLSDTPEKAGSLGWDAGLPRICSWVGLREIETGKEIYVFTTHLDYYGEQSRLESATLIRRRIAKIAGEEPWILLGDFNAPPGSDTWHKITDPGDGLARAIDSYTVSATAPKGPESTWNGFDAIEPGRRIDYVFTSENVKTLEFEILIDERGGRFSSDHLPVIATLEW